MTKRCNCNTSQCSIKMIPSMHSFKLSSHENRLARDVRNDVALWRKAPLETRNTLANVAVFLDLAPKTRSGMIMALNDPKIASAIADLAAELREVPLGSRGSMKKALPPQAIKAIGDVWKAGRMPASQWTDVEGALKNAPLTLWMKTLAKAFVESEHKQIANTYTAAGGALRAEMERLAGHTPLPKGLKPADVGRDLTEDLFFAMADGIGVVATVIIFIIFIVIFCAIQQAAFADVHSGAKSGDGLAQLMDRAASIPGGDNDYRIYKATKGDVDGYTAFGAVFDLLSAMAED